jgi:hypothetical protein
LSPIAEKESRYATNPQKYFDSTEMNSLPRWERMIRNIAQPSLDLGKGRGRIDVSHDTRIALPGLYRLLQKTFDHGDLEVGPDRSLSPAKDTFAARR